MEGCVHLHISRDSISQTYLCFLHRLNSVCHYRISQTVLLFILIYTHRVASVAIPNTMYGSQSDQSAKMAHSEPRRYEFPRGFTDQLVSYHPHSSSSSELNKLLLREKNAKTPRPTLSKAGCTENVCKVLSIRCNSKIAFHLHYKCHRATWHLSGEEKKQPTTKEQEFTTHLNTNVKQRPLCARAFCSKSTSEKFRFFFLQ